ncbi:MAG TPA: hypothetical protein VK619_11180 [Pyrinomonadaceae bacterium]|nr:hypothetical protein [Pyrinomonadaceae bacterium]
MAFLKLSLLILLLLLSLTAAQAQSTAPLPPTDATTNGPRPSREDMRLGTPEMEMRDRQEIEILQRERRDNLQRAREAAQLGTELRQSFLHNRTLSLADLKKLDRLEKLARKILSEAGGSNVDEAEHEIPTQLETAINRVAELSEEIRKTVEKTPRQVVSADVIDSSNKLLDIIRRVRELNH